MQTQKPLHDLINRRRTAKMTKKTKQSRKDENTCIRGVIVTEQDDDIQREEGEGGRS
jgi:hypothetical protein